MEYMGNKAYWEDKFSNRGDTPLNPEKALVESITYLKKGSVLDIACGDGRNALFLLEKGFEVTGADFSEAALNRLIRFAGQRNYTVVTKQVDLSKTDALKGLGVFDNIVINHYRLNFGQLKDINDHIREGGILFVCGFGEKHKVDERIRDVDLIRETDFAAVRKAFDLIKHTAVQEEIGYIVTYIFRKR